MRIEFLPDLSGKRMDDFFSFHLRLFRLGSFRFIPWRYEGSYRKVRGQENRRSFCFRCYTAAVFRYSSWSDRPLEQLEFFCKSRKNIVPCLDLRNGSEPF